MTLCGAVLCFSALRAACPGFLPQRVRGPVSRTAASAKGPRTGKKNFSDDSFPGTGGGDAGFMASGQNLHYGAVPGPGVHSPLFDDTAAAGVHHAAHRPDAGGALQRAGIPGV